MLVNGNRGSADLLLGVGSDIVDEHGAISADSLHLVHREKILRLTVVDGRGDDQRRPLNLLDGVDVVLDERVHQRLVEAVRGGNDDVEARHVDAERATLRKRIQEVEGLVPLLALLIGTEGGGLHLRQEALLELLGPDGSLIKRMRYSWQYCEEKAVRG